MPRRKEILTDKIRPYHIVGKAVEGKNIFDTEEDRARFLFQMHAANVGKPVINVYRKDILKISNALLQGAPIPSGFLLQEHAPLVQIFSFALGKDRYHLGLVPRSSKAIPQYMQKLNLGYAKYFNLKNQRKGALFEGRFLAAPVNNPRQLKDLVVYINIKRVADFFGKDSLSKYPYSSFPDLFLQRTSHVLSKESRTTLQSLLGQELFSQRENYLELLEGLLESEERLREKLFLE